MRHNAARLAALRNLMLLESLPERDYDRITQLAATSLGVPIAMVNLLDDQRDWFMSRIGLPLQESPSSKSMCEAFFHSDEDIIVVEDTRIPGGRFTAHPLVTGEPFVRFYAAARLVVAGQTVGTLCAYDLQPRQVSAEQVAELRTLAAAVKGLLDKRRA